MLSTPIIKYVGKLKKKKKELCKSGMGRCVSGNYFFFKLCEKCSCKLAMLCFFEPVIEHYAEAAPVQRTTTIRRRRCNMHFNCIQQLETSVINIAKHPLIGDILTNSV